VHRSRRPRRPVVRRTRAPVPRLNVARAVVTHTAQVQQVPRPDPQPGVVERVRVAVPRTLTTAGLSAFPAAGSFPPPGGGPHDEGRERAPWARPKRVP
jgi:hypothetical protein